MLKATLQVMSAVAGNVASDMTSGDANNVVIIVANNITRNGMWNECVNRNVNVSIGMWQEMLHQCCTQCCK